MNQLPLCPTISSTVLVKIIVRKRRSAIFYMMFLEIRNLLMMTIIPKKMTKKYISKMNQLPLCPTIS